MPLPTMNDPRDFGSSTAAEAKSPARDLRRWAGTILLLIATIWIVSLLNLVVLGGRWMRLGIVPRTEDGLLGILFSPLLHASIGHLLANSAGILVFGGLVILRSEVHFWVVTLVGVVASGFGTWLLGRPAVHIGASGVIFAYFGYLICTGWFERRAGSIILSLLVLLVWGSTIFGVFPVQRSVSWEGHLFGLLGGATAAWLLARRRH